MEIEVELCFMAKKKCECLSQINAILVNIDAFSPMACKIIGCCL